ncbi:HoxN/HupN/NixA family nickel/cobalt transporter [Amycolatopsis bartoniae]|uniref:Nickel/cobalt efflux system n=1 Tax=Amycolatopsis bartoniae TaxID=941986 RepID=A0A8H9IPJ5_9PSEU|nr:HoxN/HupN/NixA family nickel/cobalt transporter [Amycolatopsis bartoniae]TVT07639.1 HoxN/HupN/NixA family nickel/cobalt transporter [Amycolatopsis bartoniae]GHF42262.1 nickel/cobalt efflux system [Amycolatopsis bartoniae]
MRVASLWSSVLPTRADRLRLAGVSAVIVALHVVAWGMLVLLVVPRHLAVGTQVFGVGLGVTAYTLGLRHAFDADHIAAIDNTTRKLMQDGRRPVTVGFWFALGHSTVVLVLAVLIAAGARFVTALTADDSGTHEALSVVGTGISGLFLYLIAVLNLIALAGVVRVWRGLRRGEFDEAELEHQLAKRGMLNRFLGRVTRAITRPGQMYPVGLLFGVGFDTATEVTLLVLAGAGAAGGLPWFAVLVLPLLFAAGMTLLDTVDGTFMNFAYHWAFADPLRKVYYNITITGLSVAVALVIGSIELVSLLHDDLGLTDPVTTWISGLDLNNVGFVIVGLFVLVWALAIGVWRFGGLAHRWSPAKEPE